MAAELAIDDQQLTLRHLVRLFRTVCCSAGELSETEIENLKTIIESPENFDIPSWFLNRQKDRDTGKSFQNVSNNVDTSLRNDIERMKKIRLHRGLRHHWNIRVRGQHTATTGRHRKGGGAVVTKKSA